MRAIKIVIAITWCLLTVLTPALADWPASMEIGGFAVTGITGTTGDDGSGKATGRIVIPGDGTCPVDLVMNSSGAVTGSARSGFTLGGVRIGGSFMLDDGHGLQGTGVIYTTGKQITDATISVDPQSGVSANGKVSLGSGFEVSVTCEASSRGISVKGSSQRDATLDTPIATYVFKGEVEVSCSGQAIVTTATGDVERKGKVGGMTSEFKGVSCQVDPASGEGEMNVGGTNITIDLW